MAYTVTSKQQRDIKNAFSTNIAITCSLTLPISNVKIPYTDFESYISTLIRNFCHFGYCDIADW